MKKIVLNLLVLMALLLTSNVTNAGVIKEKWTIPADSEIGYCTVRTVTGVGDTLFGSNPSNSPFDTAGTVEEWKDGKLVARYDINKFCADNELGDTIMYTEDGIEFKKYATYALWTGMMMDDAGNLLVNVGPSAAHSSTCQNWVLLPASDRNAMQFLHIDKFPHANVTLGRVDIPSRMVGDITTTGAYMYLTPSQSEVMPVMYIGLDDDGKIFYDNEWSFGFFAYSTTPIDASTNVATLQTFDELDTANEEWSQDKLAAKTYIRWRGQGVSTWDTESSSFVKNTAVPQGASTSGMDVFSIDGVDYMVVPIKSATTGYRGCSVAVYEISTWQEVATWDTGSSVDYYVGSVQARVNADGKTANIYVCGHKDCFGILEFDPQGMWVNNGIYYIKNNKGNHSTAEIFKCNNIEGDLIIPDSVSYNGINYEVSGILDESFISCTEITNVTIPNTVTFIGAKAFAGSENIISVTMTSSTPPTIYNNTFSTFVYLGTTLKVPSGSGDVYKNAIGWKNFSNIEEYESVATEIKIEQSKILEVGTISEINVTVLPENSLYPTFRWTSSNTDVATVSEDGTVTAIAIGTTIITVETTDGSNLTATCEITVVEKGDNYLNAENVLVQRGQECVLPIELNNVNEISAFQCDIYLPEGLEVKTVDGNLDVNLTSRCTESHLILTSKQADGAIRIIVYSTVSDKFIGNSGEIVNVSLEVASNYVDNNVTIKNIVMSSPTGSSYLVSDFNFEVSAYTIGDSDNDTVVGATDVVNIANYILGNIPGEFNLLAADVNNDGVINVVDIVCLTNIILNNSNIVNSSNGTSSQNVICERVLSNVDAVAQEDNTLFIENFSITAGETKEIAIQMKNNVDFTALEFELYLPQGLTLSQYGNQAFVLSDRKAKSHTISSILLQPNVAKVLSYSTESMNFNNNEGAIVYFNIYADETFKGVEQIEIKNIVMATNGSENKTGNSVGYIPSNTIAIVKASLSGIESAFVEEELPVEYYNLQGVKVNNPEKGIYIKKQGEKIMKIVR